MTSFDKRLKSLSEMLGCKVPKNDASLTYEVLRKSHERQANRDIKLLQQATKQQRVARIMGESELNPHWTFSNFREDEPSDAQAIAIAQAFIDAHADESWRKDKAHLMLFYGDYGRGKSHLAGAIAHDLMRRYEVNVLYRQLSTLLQIRHSSFDFKADDSPGSQYRELEMLLHAADLLIIDEVAVNGSLLSQSAQAWFGNLLRQRLSQKKNCILITNHSIDSLRSALGQYCFESIKSYDTYVVHFTGSSKRKDILDERNAEP